MVMKRDHKEFDTSDYVKNNPYEIERLNKKKVGLMKDECNGKVMIEFVGLRSKMYSVNIQDDKLIKKAKGVKTSVVKTTIELEDYIECLHDNVIKSREQKNIRSKLHIVTTEKQHKIALSPHDEKRCLISGQTHCHGVIIVQ